MLRRLKLGKMLDTLPERLVLAKQNKLAHAAFLELVLADEIDRRDRTGATQRARTARPRPDVLLIDDFALHSLEATATGDFYEIAVERHLSGATVLTSNREPIEWLGQLADPLLAQSALDRLQSSAHELVIEGDSYRRRQKPTIPTTRRNR